MSPRSKASTPSADFYNLFHLMALRSSVVGVVITENRSYVANDVGADPHSVGQPSGIHLSAGSSECRSGCATR